MLRVCGYRLNQSSELEKGRKALPDCHHISQTFNVCHWHQHQHQDHWHQFHMTAASKHVRTNRKAKVYMRWCIQQKYQTLQAWLVCVCVCVCVYRWAASSSQSCSGAASRGANATTTTSTGWSSNSKHNALFLLMHTHVYRQRGR